MGIKERQQREKEQRYSDIVDAATRLFISREFKSVTMNDISRECEFSKGALYFYFKSKEDIAFAVMAKCYRMYIDMIDDSLGGGGRGIERIERVLRASIDFYRRYPQYIKIMGYFDYSIDYDFKASYQSDPVAMDFFYMINDYRNRVAGVIVDGIRDGSIRKGIDPGKAVLVFGDSLLNFMQKFTVREDILDSREQYSPEELIEYMVEMILYALKPGS